MSDYVYLLKIAIISAVASYVAFSKNEKKEPLYFFNRLIEGGFCGFVSYEFAFYSLKDVNISLAVCGIGAFFGVKIFDFLRDMFEKFLNKKIGGDDK